MAQAAKRPLSLPPGDHPSAGPAVSGQHDFAVYTGWAREAPFLFWLWFISQPALFSTIHLHQCVHLAEMGAEDEQQWASEQVKLVAFFFQLTTAAGRAGAWGLSRTGLPRPCCTQLEL